MALGARNAAMKNHKSIAECLADEIMNCEKESPNSYAIKKKDEIEKVSLLPRYDLKPYPVKDKAEQ